MKKKKTKQTNFKRNIKSFIDGIFYGLKGADNVISTQASYGSSDTEIVQTQTKDNVYNDLLRGEETQRVKELRDEFYRTIDKSKDFKVEISGVNKKDFEENLDDENVTLTATATKKTALDFVCKIEVYNPEKLHLKCIQDNIQVPEKGAFSQTDNTENLEKGNQNMLVGGMLSDKHVSIFKIKRDSFLPRFKLEDYANKVVIRVLDDNTSLVDFYVSAYPSQFGFVYELGKNGKIHAKKDNSSLLISELKRLLEKQIRTSDVVEMSEFSFETENAYGVPNPSYFEFDNMEYKGIDTFDGNFVITLKAHNKYISSAIEKYHTDELDEKLKNNSVREGKDVDLYTVMRHNEKLNKEYVEKLPSDDIFVDNKDSKKIIKKALKEGNSRTFIEKGTGTRVNINMKNE